MQGYTSKYSMNVIIAARIAKGEISFDERAQDELSLTTGHWIASSFQTGRERERERESQFV